ncbi:hypothetical protein MNB_SV-5-1390 [hydrothermal vent metagenome]|uniref:DUF945 domain-containing protein n=1 Tax=hydrothermal vent metagenome TaxID=652676 RepID=A0A1W1EBY3_9ZZZZ
MKKSILGIVGIALIAIIYYFTSGSEQLTKDMKERVNTELTMLQKSGFAIQNRDIKKSEEHFVILFDDSKKMMSFFKKQGSKVNIEDMEELKGLKLGVDLKYLNDTYSALSADIYPLNLPDSISDEKDLTEKDKQVIKQIDEMLARKALLIHVDFNKLLSSFKGYIKDIDETFKLESNTKINIDGMTFEGTIKDDKVNSIIQKIKNVKVQSDDNLTLSLKELSSDYTLTGKTIYDTTYNYRVKQISAIGKDGSNSYSMNITDIKGDNITQVIDSLASNKMSFSVGDIEAVNNDNIVKFADTIFSFNIDRLDINALKSLENVDVENEAEVNKLIQQLISKGVTMEIPKFEVKKIEYLGEKMDGFSISSTFKVKDTANIMDIQKNPFTALQAIDIETKLILSDTLYTFIAKQPQAMMLVMIAQPKIINGKKVYELELKDGKFSINGKSMM